MSDYAVLGTRADDLLQNQGSALKDDAKAQAFREALSRYNRDAPLAVWEDFSGNGTAYQFSFTGDFAVGFSQIKSVEYPTGERPQRYLVASDYHVYQSNATTVVLELPYNTPGAGETVRVVYTARHTIEDLDTATATTIPEWHEEALVTLAASRMLARLAGRFIHEQDSTIDADATNRSSKDESAAKRSRALEQDYRDLMGIRKGVVPGMVTIDWDTSLSGSGVDHLTHPRRWQ